MGWVRKKMNNQGIYNEEADGSSRASCEVAGAGDDARNDCDDDGWLSPAIGSRGNETIEHGAFKGGGSDYGADDESNFGGSSVFDFGTNPLLQAGTSQYGLSYDPSTQKNLAQDTESLQLMNDEPFVHMLTPVGDHDSRSILMRQWIKKALESVAGSSNITSAITSSPYLNASLKIAVSLAKQISRAEDMASKGMYHMLDQLPTSYGCDWADCVQIRLKSSKDSAKLKANSVPGSDQYKDVQEEGSLQIEPMPFASLKREAGQDFNTRIDSFLQSFDDNERKRGIAVSAEDLILNDDSFSVNFDQQESQKEYGWLHTEAESSIHDDTHQGEHKQESRTKNDELTGGWDSLVDYDNFFGTSQSDESAALAPHNFRHSSGLASPALESVDGNHQARDGHLNGSLHQFNYKDAQKLLLTLEDEHPEEESETMNDEAKERRERVQWTTESAKILNNNLFQEDEHPQSAQQNPRYACGLSSQALKSKESDQTSNSDKFIHTFQEDETKPSAFKSMEPGTKGPNYLDVESSELQRPAGILSHAHDVNTKDSGTKRIYNLGLLLYELFSGGESPNPTLYALVFSDGAFVSLPTLSLAEEKDDSKYTHGPSKRRHSSSADPNSDKICRSACNRLRLLGVPGQLCQLIFNMLDCIYGDLSENDCYTTMNDVIDDLQLMLEKPFKFLRNSFDSGRQSFSGLQLKDTFNSRDTEFASLRSCYCRSISGPCEVAIIAGESGTGKSFLASRLGRSISAQGGIFLTGKFGMEQGAPFSALASAFDQYCDILIKEKDAEWVKVIVEKLQAALGQDACHLIKVIPSLGHIMPPSLHFPDSIRDQDSVHALQRLSYLLCQFVEVISMTSLTLFLDDLQWADSTTFLVLNQLLRSQYQPSSKGHKQFFFLTCVRDTEMNDDHPFWKMTDNIQAFGLNYTTIKLECMSKDKLNEKVSDLLCLSPRLVKSLSDIVYSKTKGNPLFFSQTMLSLNRDNLLRLSLPQQRWVWDEEEIQSRKLPENAAMCFANGIKNLPFEVQCAVRTLSMFGTCAKFRHIAALEIQLNTKLIEPLKVAAAEGLVIHRKGSFAFTHDRIMEAAYGMIKEEDRRLDHSTIGLCLMKLSLETHDDETHFMAANQINRGGASAVRSESDLITMVKCNLSAGKRSIQMSDFSSAAKFFTFAMSFLPDNHWVNHYSLSLELFELACRAALVTRNMESLNCFSNEVAKHARSFGDKLNTYFIVMISLAYASKVSDAFDNGCAILSQLGVSIPSIVSDDSLAEQVQYTQSLIKGMSEDDILNIRLMTDNSKLMAMKFLAKLASIAIYVKPILHPFVTLQIVQLTMSHGLSPMSPIGFAHFGALLAKHDIQVGYRLTLLAKQLVDKLESKEVEGEVIGMLCEIECFVKPLQTSNELRSVAETSSMASGDVAMACVNRLLYCSAQLWWGNNLPLLKETVSKALRFMKEHEHTTTLLFLLTVQKTVLTLIGNESEGLSDDELETIIKENRNPRQTKVLLYLSFVLCDGMLKEKYERFLQNEKPSHLMFFDSMATFIIGLGACKLFRETRAQCFNEMALKCTKDMKLWNEQGSKWNFHHKQLLLEAEMYYSDGNFEKAEISYQKAIECARAHKFVHEEALAFELVAKFYLDTGDTESSLAHFKLAHQSYLEWGATFKAGALFLLMEEKFGDICTKSNDGHDSTEVDLQCQNDKLGSEKGEGL